MTEDELRAVEERRQDALFLCSEYGVSQLLKTDIPALLAEVRRLREICERWENLSPVWRKE